MRANVIFVGLISAIEEKPKDQWKSCSIDSLSVNDIKESFPPIKLKDFKELKQKMIVKIGFFIIKF